MSGTAISSLPSLGPAFQADCIKAGIPDAETLRELGPGVAYRRLLLSGVKPHFVWYMVIHMTLQGRPWNDAQGTEKARMRAEFEAMKLEVKATLRSQRPDELGPDLEAALDLLGVRPRGSAGVATR